MSHLTADQIAQSAYAAGFRGNGLATAVAVAMAESGGNNDAHNAVPPDNSYGLWQINMLGGMGPERRREFHIGSNDQLFNPETNAKAAYQVSDGGKSFEPWSTYTNGAYKDHLAAARKAADDVTASKKHHAPAPPHKPVAVSPHKPTPKPTPPPNGRGGFTVDPAALAAYAKQAGDVGDDLRNIGQKTVGAVHGIAENSFGEVGKETGFTDALADFSTTLQQQIDTLASDARQLGSAAEEDAKAYEKADESAANDIKSVLG